MNRYQKTFAALKRKGQIAFIPFAVAGDPDLKTSEAIFKAYIDGGADVLEIGYPFSDPVADGPINQRAAIRSINCGLVHASFFKLVEKIRSYADCPIGILMYANSARHLGYDVFCKRAADAGIDSLLVADMPPEESVGLASSMRKRGLKTVYIVSELTPAERMRYICKHVSGFVYVVSRLGPTGVQKKINVTVDKTLARLRGVTDKPLCAGFGISTPGHVQRMKAAGADGAIVGSALVKIIEDNLKNKPRMIRLLSDSVKKFKEATKE
ncbi:MAG TPA: tryptophan synthase subunit alpha [Chitinivibrionales bacterium]|nr:tryptophan synthase subunit alpha [Chitinivibrionales bacterium]